VGAGVIGKPQISFYGAMEDLSVGWSGARYLPVFDTAIPYQLAWAKAFVPETKGSKF